MVAFAAADDGVFAETFVFVGQHIGIVRFFSGMVRIVGFSRFAVEQNRFAVDKTARFFVGRRQTGFHQSLNHVEALGNFKSRQAVESELFKVAFGQAALVFGKQTFGNALRGFQGGFAVNQAGHFFGKDALRFGLGTAGFVFGFDGVVF